MPTRDPLFGRDDLTARFAELLDRSPAGGGSVGLTGEAGVGKSALLRVVADEAGERGFTVLTARGSEAETHLPFASLHQVLRPLLPRTAVLPARQRDALLSGFGMSDVQAPDPFLVSLAALELLSEAARDAPVLAVLDDLQWMDEPSADVLAFVARRIAAEPVLLLAAARTGSTPLLDDPSFEWVTVPDLDGGSAEALLAARAPGLAPDLRGRVLREAAGNPLALLEFPTAMASGRFGWTELSDDLPMTTRLERAFATRVGHLPAGTRTLLTVAALDDGARLAEMLSATALLVGSEDPDVARPALEDGLLVSDGLDVQFRHPLVRSALRQTLDPAATRAVHAALARVLREGGSDGAPDRAAWHRAAATATVDEEAAADLEAAARRAVRRGALGSAVAWLQRAAALSPDPAARGARLIGAAEVAFELGRFRQVERLKQQVSTTPLQPRDRSRLIWLEGAFDDGSSADPVEVRRLIGLAETSLRSADPDLALQLLFGAARRAWWGEPGDDVRDELIRVARAASPTEDDPRLLAVLALTRATEQAATVLRGLDRWSAGGGVPPDLVAMLGIAAFCVGDFTRAMAFLAPVVDQLRVEDRLSVLAEALAILSWSAIYLGAFEAGRGADEAMRLADSTGRSLWGAAARPALVVLEVLRGAGHGPAERDLLADADRVALAAASPMTTVLASVQWARGLQELAAARYDVAYGQLRRVFDPADAAHHPVQQVWTLGYLVEAAVATGRADDARGLLEALEPLVGAEPPPAAAVALEYARAVLAPDASAEGAFALALAGAARHLPWHRARVELAYGSWLRRQRRVVESRDRLRSARDTFVAVGARPWAERADQELRATGERGRSLDPTARERLSPQESEIAHLAARGLSNREIAQRLYLSHRTVGSHLYRIFPKLGVTSRSQLGAVLTVD